MTVATLELQVIPKARRSELVQSRYCRVVVHMVECRVGHTETGAEFSEQGAR